MRTHRIKITCNSEEGADWCEENSVQEFFNDFTHWYCGFDHVGDDTPDSCIIYRGVLNPNVIYIEFDAKNIFNGDIEDNATTVMNHFHAGKTDGDIYYVIDVEMKHLDSYDKICELEHIADAQYHQLNELSGDIDE